MAKRLGNCGTRMIYSASHNASSFTGTARQLLEAGLIPDADVLPGQTSELHTQAFYTEDWEQVPADDRRQRYAIYLRGETRFELIVWLSDEEREYRASTISVQASSAARYTAREFDAGFQRLMSRVAQSSSE